MSNPAVSGNPVEISQAMQWSIIGGMTVVAGLIVLATGAHRPRSVLGASPPTRDRPLAPLAAATAMALVCWLVSQGLYLMPKASGRAPPSGAAPDLSPADVAFLGTIPALLGAGVFVAMLLSSEGLWLARLGFTWQRLRRAPMVAILAILVTYPLVFWSLHGLEHFYQLIEFEHPREHEILRLLGEQSSPALRMALALAAIVAAPLFEELFFRGGLQTLLSRLLRAHESAGRAWLAIIVTSVPFALIHSLWMAPVIFLLSLCFGYVYQRTANLPAVILMHAIFNATNTLYYYLNLPPT
ncbi:MAG: CPBP family intramembrane metalloprotease [Phycisphaerae bacterium]|nr:CPBP family intramembrane metalloprotease [Phycisphaerae bacterium]MDW8262921.1 type II CAAX endopeptidase family protein [Phycisphaerales bacterium]